MYSRKGLANIISLLNIGYKQRKWSIKINHFVGCLSFLKALESAGLISCYTKFNKGFGSGYHVYLRYRSKNGFNPIFKFKFLKYSYKKLENVVYSYKKIKSLYVFGILYIF